MGHTGGGRPGGHRSTRDDLAAKIDRQQPFVLLETLPERYYRKAHLPGALLMPHDRVAELAATLIPSTASEVVVNCASDTCKDSHQAAEALRNLGYERVSVYFGGKADWQGVAADRAVSRALAGPQ